MKAKSRARYIIAALALAVLIMALVCLFVGASRMSFSDGVAALFGKGSAANVRILRSIRVPRVLAALIAGAALSVSGLVMQTTLSNAMASPSTMGVSNAAVFGANLSIIVFAGGFLSTGNQSCQLHRRGEPVRRERDGLSLLGAFHSAHSRALPREGVLTERRGARGHRRRRDLDGGNDASAVLRHGRRPFRRSRVEFRRSRPRDI